jgi:hypothetical protein
MDNVIVVTHCAELVLVKEFLVAQLLCLGATAVVQPEVDLLAATDGLRLCIFPRVGLAQMWVAFKELAPIS